MNVPANMVNAARNFAKTIPMRLIGEVSRSCSVRIFLSSLKLFIVRSGTRIMNMNMTIMKYVPTLESSPAIRVKSEKMNEFSARNTAIKT